MKLSSILEMYHRPAPWKSRNTEHDHTCYEVENLIEPPNSYYGPMDVVVHYELTPPSHSDHPYQDTTAREYHDAEIDVMSLIADQDFTQFAEDDSVIKVWPKGTNIEKIPGFDPKKHLKYFHDQAWENHKDD